MPTGGKYGVIVAFATKELRVGLVGIQTFLVKEKGGLSAKRFGIMSSFFKHGM